MYAAQVNAVECARLVLAAQEAQLMAVSKEGRNALMQAAMKGRSQIVQLLLEQPCVREQVVAVDGKNMNALMLACRNDRPECAKLILAAGDAAAQVQAKDA